MIKPAQVFFSGPKLPMKISGAAMVTSPTGRGVILIGGETCTETKGPASWQSGQHHDVMLELSGDTIGTLFTQASKKLKWRRLDQRLKYAREGHAAFPINDQLYLNLINSTTESVPETESCDLNRKTLKRSHSSSEDV